MDSGQRLRVEVLGPIRVVDAAGRDLTPSGVLQRRLLALLVLRRGRVVPAWDVIEALWPDRPPRDVAAALHNQVFRLRRRLPVGVVESIANGYVLSPVSVEIDADCLADAVRDGDLGPDTLAALDAVLDRWRGPAYPELADVDDARVEAARLEELRLRAVEARVGCRLAAGEADDVVPELSRLVDEHPLRERPRSLLMTALARAGRRVEALRAYDDFRRLLGDELGIEPSAALAAQHAALLTDSPEMPAARAAPPASGLPVAATSLVGRAALVEDVAAAVESHRVVTLVGPAGVGKTRLAVEVGHRLRAAGGDRPVALCDLATAGPASVLEQLAAELGIDPRAGTSLTERIAEVLAGGPLVLVLDGCEHVLDAVAGLAERLVARGPDVRVLATSRERLRIPGERVVPVPPLPCDDDRAAGAQLFIERARAAAPGFDPDPDELAAVADIARRLDGLPLAIELAAARLHTHGLTEVAAGLDERFSLLSAGYRTSTRHGSLRSAVSWSYELLDERLQHTFADLSTFAGSFTAADAAAVTDRHPDAAAEHLAQLVERSLVTRAAGGRYVLLETLRAFGAEQLVAGGRAAAVRERHARHMLAWAAEANSRLLAGGPRVMTAMDVAVPDLRAALDWLLDCGRVDLASQLVVDLRDYGLLRQRPDVLAWADRVVDNDPEGRDPLAPCVWVASAYAAWMVGDVPGTGVRTERARVLAEAGGGIVPEEVATMCGSHALFEGRLQDAAGWYRRAADTAIRTGNAAKWMIAAGSELLALAYAGDPTAADRAAELIADVGDAATPYAAYVWHCAGEAELAVDDERARGRFTRAIELAELTGAALVLGLAGASQASIDARVGDPATAAAAYRWLIPHWRRAGVWSTQWTMLRAIAVLLDRLGRHREAAVLEGAVRATGAGHRIYGADEAALAELAIRLRAALGEAGYDAARREGAGLEGAAAADLALRALA